MLASSTPDALWAAPAARAVQAAAVACRGVDRRPYLKDCSFRVARGVRLVVVAEPQASATTLLRVLAGLARHSSGRVVVAGIDGPDAARDSGRVSYLGPEPGIHGWMTPREAVGLAAAVLGLDAAETRRRVVHAVEWAEIADTDLDRPVRRGGASLIQRVGLAAAIVADPEVLLLDEPLQALPPADRRRLLAFPDRRRTILVASRDPAGDASMATHVMLLRDGRVVALVPVGSLAADGRPLSRDGILAFADAHPVPVPALTIHPRSAAPTR